MAIRTLLWRGLDAPRMEIVRVESLDRAHGTSRSGTGWCATAPAATRRTSVSMRTDSSPSTRITSNGSGEAASSGPVSTAERPGSSVTSTITLASGVMVSSLPWRCLAVGEVEVDGELRTVVSGTPPRRRPAGTAPGRDLQFIGINGTVAGQAWGQPARHRPGSGVRCLVAVAARSSAAVTSGSLALAC